ncbi:aldolase [Chelatococcus asaccharovorans]|uniref:3-oxo-tetronate 4-phosphate decarboxylase n=1 Tax=Chelatococcus asaccharovorans TaxID=28210 RepID=A0A2V3TRY3_9HYPH|nr:aldolase [Chelatococcus asaccharovorans]MBS7704906.1 aldolase [Chelatococcus asaccharovorans]PXW51369.1 ribulose-5-phosphate 4-epimerase/fuculose-1-phosphate aldolase [Chelatococcus asaccharovorans]
MSGLEAEAQLRTRIAMWGRSLFARGFTVGSSGNISVKLEDGFLVTPTNSCFGFLDAARISKLDQDWRHVGGDAPTKELPLHRAFYEARPATGAVVHLHSTYATALSCLADVDPEDAITPITPYVVMRVGRVPVLPYTAPGSADVAPLVAARAGAHAAVLLANHGPVVAGTSLDSAVFAAEELEETAKLLVITRGLAVRSLDQGQIDQLNARFALK